MSISRSDKFYFPRGDLVLQVENTLFRVHQDILARHSGFFDDMLSTTTSDDTEGTEKNPLVLSTDLCSARSFTILCKLLYPLKMGSRLDISVKHLGEWEQVLRATVALQMDDTRKFILARFGEDAPNIKRDTAKLLRLCLDYEEAPPSLLTTCLRILACRRKQITPEEVRVLGGEGTCLVNRVRESVRDTLGVDLVRLLQRSRDILPDEHIDCIPNAFAKMVHTSADKGPRSTDDTYDIFRDALGWISCNSCFSPWKMVVESCRGLSTKIVDRHVRGVSTPDVSNT